MVATPIGNLEDISLRALRVLREADMVLAEDTRVTRKLLSHYDIHTPVSSYHAHSPESATDHFVERMLAGHNLALVADAGTPGISDPGDRIVSRAVANGIRVIPIPGPNAAVSLMSISGIPGGRFTFVGFPPRGRSDRRAFFAELKEIEGPVILYEAPQRIGPSLTELLSALGDRNVTIGRELTKRFETILRCPISRAIEQLSPDRQRGEFTVLVHPADRNGPTSADDSLVDAAVARFTEASLPPREAARAVARATGLSAREAYRRILEKKSDA